MTEAIERYVDYKNAMSTPTEWLNTPSGTALWLDGLRAIDSIDLNQLFDNQFRFGSTKEHDLGLKILMSGYEPLKTTGSISVINDQIAYVLSPLYRRIRVGFQQNKNMLELAANLKSAPFEPWSKTIALAPPYVSSRQGQPRIQFFTFHHEACHHAIFGDLYRKAPEENEQDIVLSLILAEWFCIALDLVIANEMGSFNHELHSLHELADIEKDKFSAKSDRVLTQAARSKRFAVDTSDNLKQCFLASMTSSGYGQKFEITERLLGCDVVNFHTQFARDDLVHRLPSSTDSSLKSRRAAVTQKLMDWNAFEIGEALCNFNF